MNLCAFYVRYSTCMSVLVSLIEFKCACMHLCTYICACVRLCAYECVCWRVFRDLKGLINICVYMDFSEYL